MNLNPRLWFKEAEAPAKTDPVGIGAPTEGEVAHDNLLTSGLVGKIPKYDPDLLKVTKGKYVYEKMMTDDQVKPVLRFKQASVISRKWYFDVPTDDDGQPDEEQQRIADFFTYNLDTMKNNFTDVMVGILSAMIQGYSFSEKIWKPIQWDGRTWWGVGNIKLRPWDTFDGGITVDEFGNINELRQTIGGTGIALPPEKFIHFVHQPDEDPHYGESDLRAAYRSFWYKDVVLKFQSIFLERFSSGMLIVKVPNKMDPKWKNAIKGFLNNISARAGMMVPDDVEVEMNALRDNQAFDKAIAQYDKAIAKSILVPNLLGLSQQGATGSFAQSETQLKAFLWILASIAARLEDTLNEQLFAQLAWWNFNTTEYPKFTFEPMGEDQKNETVKTWSDLVSKGAVTKSDSDEAHTRRLMGYPEKAEPEEPETPEPPDDTDLPEEPATEEEIEARLTEWIDGIKDIDHQMRARVELAEKPWLRRVNVPKLDKTFTSEDAAFAEGLADIMAKVKSSVLEQTRALVGNKNMGRLAPTATEKVKVPPNLVKQIRAFVRKQTTATFGMGEEQAAQDLPAIPKKFAVKFAVKVIRPGTDIGRADRFVSSQSMKIAGILEDDVNKAVSAVLANGIKYDKSLKQVIDAIEQDTALVAALPRVDAGGRRINVPARMENIARTTNATAINAARQAVFESPQLEGFIQAFEYSAILDDRTSEICEALDGRIRRDWGSSAPPNHFQCRSILVPITAVDPWDGKQSKLPAIQPQKEFS